MLCLGGLFLNFICKHTRFQGTIVRRTRNIYVVMSNSIPEKYFRAKEICQLLPIPRWQEHMVKTPFHKLGHQLL